MDHIIQIVFPIQLVCKVKPIKKPLKKKINIPEELKFAILHSALIAERFREPINN